MNTLSGIIGFLLVATPLILGLIILSWLSLCIMKAYSNNNLKTWEELQNWQVPAGLVKLFFNIPVINILCIDIFSTEPNAIQVFMAGIALLGFAGLFYLWWPTVFFVLSIWITKIILTAITQRKIRRNT